MQTGLNNVQKFDYAVGFCKEAKQGENRVVITPNDLKRVAEAYPANLFMVEDNAGVGSGFSNEDYLASGLSNIKIVSREVLYDASHLIVGVKEPLEQELPLLRRGQTIFKFLHLPPNKKLYQALKDQGIASIAFELVAEADGSRPILREMSEVAAEYSVLVGDKHRTKPWSENTVAVLGAMGVYGRTVMNLMKAREAFVIGFDIYADKKETENILKALNELSCPAHCGAAHDASDLFQKLNGRVLYPSGEILRTLTGTFDHFYSGVAGKSDAAPVIYNNEMLCLMKDGAFYADASIDEGGSTSINLDPQTGRTKATSHAKPVLEWTTDRGSKVLYCGVPNMPGGLPKMATKKISGVVSIYLNKLLRHVDSATGIKKSIRSVPALAGAVCLIDGKTTDKKLADKFGDEYFPVSEILK